jgi:hypothetical protein
VHACANVFHLEDVTHQVNIQRGDKHSNTATCRSGRHPWDPANAIVNNGRLSCRACRNETVRRYRANKN